MLLLKRALKCSSVPIRQLGIGAFRRNAHRVSAIQISTPRWGFFACDPVIQELFARFLPRGRMNLFTRHPMS